MNEIVPRSRPAIAAKDVEKIIREHGVADFAVVFVGVRGYYLNMMGAAGVNDRGIYDDAICIHSPNVFAAFNANTDPSIFRPGVATLVPGVHMYKKGKHGTSRPNPYDAFRPATPDEGLPVTRDGQRGTKRGFYINIHRGSYTSTSSLGCQTIYPAQWNAFQSLGYLELDRAKQKEVPYVLVEI